MNNMSPSKREREASVDNLLAHVHSGTTSLSDEEFQRLKLLEFAGWFHGPDRDLEAENPAAWLRRGNVEDWITHYFFRGATPEEVKAMRGGSEELCNLVDMVLEFTGISLGEGRNPNIRPHLLMSDPLPVVHRPLLVYVGSSLICPFMTHQVMRFFGFERERIGGLSYWHRGLRDGIRADVDIAGSRRIPLVFLHGLGVGLVPYYLFLYHLSEHYSGELFVPELPFLAMMPWERVPSAREVVAQLQDMLAAHRCVGAHFAGHSFGTVILSWMIKSSPTSIICCTLIEPAAMLSIKSDLLQKMMWDPPINAVYEFLRYFVFRELFTMNLLCRCSFWEQSTLWPEEITTPAVVELASEDAVVSSFFVRRLLEHERAARKQKKRSTDLRRLRTQAMVPSGSAVDIHSKEAQDNEAYLDIMWIDNFMHGQIFFSRKQTLKLLSKMKQMVQDAHGDQVVKQVSRQSSE
jgi:pimeloyl-ACP methyl ester carboxylesterase